jgi:hypothetical protein
MIDDQSSDDSGDEDDDEEFCQSSLGDSDPAE